jgi:hypothetical protein
MIDSICIPGEFLRAKPLRKAWSAGRRTQQISIIPEVSVRRRSTKRRPLHRVYPARMPRPGLPGRLSDYRLVVGFLRCGDGDVSALTNRCRLLFLGFHNRFLPWAAVSSTGSRKLRSTIWQRRERIAAHRAFAGGPHPGGRHLAAHSIQPSRFIRARRATSSGVGGSIA